MMDSSVPQGPQAQASKEDLQMTIPVSYDDAFNAWPSVLESLSSRLPLRDVVCKSPTLGSSVTIPSLPVRFMPSTAKLFVDTDHPYRWFLAPYVELYVVRVENLDTYKTAKPAIRAWVDARNNSSSSSSSSIKKLSWLILYLPVGSPASLDAYNKVYARISADFYMDKVGDRSTFILLAQEYLSQSLEVPAQHAVSLGEFVSRLKKCITASFQLRTALYDADIRRLDSLRGTPQLDFRQLFLVKESLALMYQMMQLPNEAFIQYEELEALLSFVPTGHLPDNDWPVSTADSSSSSKSTTNSKQHALELAVQGPVDSDASSSTNVPTPPPLPPLASPSSAAVKNGEEVLIYSINSSRMKILRNKLSVAELFRYLFARQMYFLACLKNTAQSAQKGMLFLRSSMISIRESLAKKKGGPGEQQAGKDALKLSQACLWGFYASIQIARTCQDQLLAQQARDSLVRDSSQHLSEIMHFALGLLKNLTPILVESRVESIAEALKFKCWRDNPPSGDSRARLPNVSINDTAQPLQLSSLRDDIIAFVQMLRDSANTLVNLTSNNYFNEEAREQADLVISFLKILRQFDLVAERRRSAAHVNVMLADVFMKIGAHENALDVYLDTLSSTVAQPTQVVPPTLMFQNWDRVKYIVLRKALLCAREASDSLTYTHTAVRLLAPPMIEVSKEEMAGGAMHNEDWTRSLLHDVATLTPNAKQQLGCSGKNFQPQPLRSYFSATIVFDSSTQQEVTSKMIYHESTLVSVARLFGGEEHKLFVEIVSPFPECVTVDSLTVTYASFNLLFASAVAVRGEDAKLLLREFDKDNMFVCECALSREIVITPGRQLVEMKFAAPCTGEYGLLGIKMRLGTVELQETFDCASISEVQQFCQINPIVSIEQPPKVLDLKAGAPVFSPLGQSDDLLVSFSTQDGDQLTGLRVWAIPSLVSPEDAKRGGRRDDVDTEAHGEGMDSWSKKLQPPAPPSSSIHVPISIDKVAQWTVTRNAAKSSDFTATPKRESSGLEHLSFSPLRGQAEMTLKIPFTSDGSLGIVAPTDGKKGKKAPTGKIVVSLVLQGVLLRRGCAIAFDQRTECTVTVSDGLHVQSLPVGLFGDEFFLQCVLLNSSSIPLAIKNYSLTCHAEGGSAGGGRINLWTVLEGPSDLVDESASTKSASDGGGRGGFGNLILHPGNEYHAAFRIKMAGLINADGRDGYAAKHLAQAIFTYQRRGEILENKLTSPWNSREFRMAGHIRQLHTLLASSGAYFKLFSEVVSAPTSGNVKLGTIVRFSNTLEIAEVVPSAKDSLLSTEIVIRLGEGEGWAPVNESRIFRRCEKPDRVSVGEGIKVSSTFSFESTYIPVQIGDLLPPSAQIYHRLVGHQKQQPLPASLEEDAFVHIRPSARTKSIRVVA